MTKSKKVHNPERASDRTITETDLAQKKMGSNQLQGDGQSNVRNQRQAVPDVRKQPDDGLIETFEKADKEVRARRELGKGQGVHPRHARDDRTDGAED